MLIDTSAWIDYFKGRDPAASKVEQLISDDRATVRGPVQLELRRGIRDSERERVLPLLDALNYVSTLDTHFQSAGDLLADLRAHAGALHGRTPLLGAGRSEFAGQAVVGRFALLGHEPA